MGRPMARQGARTKGCRMAMPTIGPQRERERALVKSDRGPQELQLHGRYKSTTSGFTYDPPAGLSIISSFPTPKHLLPSPLPLTRPLYSLTSPSAVSRRSAPLTLTSFLCPDKVFPLRSPPCGHRKVTVILACRLLCGLQTVTTGEYR